MIGKKINQLATELAPESTDLTIIGDPTTGVSKKITLAQLGAIFSGAVSFYNDLASFPATGDINVIYCAKDTQKLYLWSGSAYVEVFPSQALLDTYQLRSEKGNANGYASLDSQGKVPITQLPSSIMEYKGTWNASTNTPTLANGTGDTGDVYICNVAGTVNFGAGPLTFAVGDYTIYSGSIWQRSSGAVGTVTSVAASITGDSVTISGSPVTTSGTLAFAFAGTGAQYIKGDGTLATFPSIISQAQNLVTEVYNKTGATLTKGTVVYINGGQGNLPTITKALATGDSTSAQTYGIVQADITNNNNGYVVVAGRLSDIDTQAFTEGTQLYLSSTTAGAYTSTKQYAPAHLVYVGIIVRSHPTQGIIEVKIQNGYELDELHNVAAQNPDNNDIIQYKTSTGLWTKVAGTTSNIAEGSNLYYTDARSRAALSFTAGSGAYNSTTGVITIPTNNNQITNGANYITLASLSAGAGISYNNTTGVIASTITQYTDALARAAISLTTTGTSGAATYNSTTGVLNVPQYAPDLSGYVPTSRTLTINGTAFDLSANRSWSVGTVTSVAALTIGTSGTDLSSTVANGTTTPVITLNVPTASATNRGALSSTDWTTFNNKQNALTNPVTGTGTTNYLPKFTGASTIGNSQIFDNGTNVGINIATPLSKLDVRDASAVMGNYQTIQAFSTDSAAINLGGGISLGGFYSGTSLIAQFGSIVGRKENSTSGNYDGYLAFGTNSQATGVRETMRLTSSGNLGLGVTPSAWSTTLAKAIQVGNLGSSIWSYTQSNTSTPYTFVDNNAYYDGTNNIYIVNNRGAARYQQVNNEHRWEVAPSGTAGNAISFTQAMTLNASGNLSIGNTNDTFKLDVTGTLRATGAATFSSSVDATIANLSLGLKVTGSNLSSGTGAEIVYSSGKGIFLTFNRGAGTYLPTEIDGSTVTLSTSGSPRLTVASGGNVGIGTTSPTGRLMLYQSSAGNVFQNIVSNQGGSTQVGINLSPSMTDGEAAANPAQASIYATDSNFGANIIFANKTTGAVGNSLTPRMTITSGGRVGIGAINPTTSLEVRGTGNTAINSAGNLMVSSGGTASQSAETGGQISFGAWLNGDLSNPYPLASIRGVSESSTTNNNRGALIFGTMDSNTAVQERMRITSGGVLKIGNGGTADDGLNPGYKNVAISFNNAQNRGEIQAVQQGLLVYPLVLNGAGGNVGIGTYSPTATLHVNGTIRTSAPTNGTSQPWKLGNAVSGGVTTNHYLVVEINGQAYTINAFNGFP